MTSIRLAALAALLCSTATAQQMEQHDAHVHGVGALDIALEGAVLAMELRAPGADIVGFEHEAASEADRAAVSDALELLTDAAALFVPSEAAECTIVAASAELHGEEDDGHGDHEDHSDGDDHEDHDDGDDHEDHAEGEGHEDHAEGAEAEAGHTEFHADYEWNCAHPEKLTRLNLPYFNRFEAAEALEIRVISGKGSFGADVEREAAFLDLEGRI